MTDADLLAAALAATGLTPYALWRHVLGEPHASKVYGRLDGTTPLPPSARVLCVMLLAHPELLLVARGAVDAIRADAIPITSSVQEPTDG